MYPYTIENVSMMYDISSTKQEQPHIPDEKMETFWEKCKSFFYYPILLCKRNKPTVYSPLDIYTVVE